MYWMFCAFLTVVSHFIAGICILFTLNSTHHIYRVASSFALFGICLPAVIYAHYLSSIVLGDFSFPVASSIGPLIFLVFGVLPIVGGYKIGEKFDRAITQTEYLYRDPTDLIKKFEGIGTPEYLERNVIREKRSVKIKNDAIKSALSAPHMMEVLNLHGADQQDLSLFFDSEILMGIAPELRHLPMRNARIVGWYLSFSTPTTNEQGIRQRHVPYSQTVQLSNYIQDRVIWL